MNSSPTYLTPEGFEKLQQELDYLKTDRRREVAERLHRAVEEAGTDNLAEDAEYEAAKNEQAFVEGRIRHLDYILTKAHIIPDGDFDEVQVGAKVTIQEDDMDLEVYSIVGAEEANPREGLISNESPLGVALMGHKSGDEIDVMAPNGGYKIKLIKVE